MMMNEATRLFAFAPQESLSLKERHIKRLETPCELEALLERGMKPLASCTKEYENVPLYYNNKLTDENLLPAIFQLCLTSIQKDSFIEEGIRILAKDFYKRFYVSLDMDKNGHWSLSYRAGSNNTTTFIDIKNVSQCPIIEEYFDTFPAIMTYGKKDPLAQRILMKRIFSIIRPAFHAHLPLIFPTPPEKTIPPEVGSKIVELFYRALPKIRLLGVDNELVSEMLYMMTHEFVDIVACDDHVFQIHPSCLDDPLYVKWGGKPLLNIYAESLPFASAKQLAKLITLISQADQSDCISLSLMMTHVWMSNQNSETATRRDKKEHLISLLRHGQWKDRHYHYDL